MITDDIEKGKRGGREQKGKKEREKQIKFKIMRTKMRGNKSDWYIEKEKERERESERGKKRECESKKDIEKEIKIKRQESEWEIMKDIARERKEKGKKGRKRREGNIEKEEGLNIVWERQRQKKR